MTGNISIINYTPAYRSEMLRLLIALHGAYFKENAPQQFQELREEKDMTGAYESYLDTIGKCPGGTWQAYLAMDGAGRAIGMIIGSITEDEALLLDKIGKFEDWYVDQGMRGKGVGYKLYNELEKWFREKGCAQICSDTWAGNELSISAHKKMGFFISGISFSKKL